MIAPPRLREGDKVALLSPARWPKQEMVSCFCDVLERHKLVPVVLPQATEKLLMPDGRVGQLAGTDDVRAAAFNAALRDPSIKALFFPRGGTGCYRLLDKIDYAAFAAQPKIIMGFSDLDSLLSALSLKAGVITFRGPMGVNFADSKRDPRTEVDAFDLLFGRKTNWEWEGATVLREGEAEGILSGGNLSVLNTVIGTPYAESGEGKIVVIEDCDELYFRIDRFLYQASRAGRFKGAKAILFGTLENILDGEQHDGSGSPFGIDILAMLKDYVPSDIPLAYGLPLGHGRPLSAHPLGARVRLLAEGALVRMELLEPIVI